MPFQSRLPVLTAVILTVSAGFAAAQPAQQTAQEAAKVIEQWGLIGKWARDCQRAPARGVVLLTYTKAVDGSVTRTATAGATPNTSEILGARLTPSGDIEITEKDDK